MLATAIGRCLLAVVYNLDIRKRPHFFECISKKCGFLFWISGKEDVMNVKDYLEVFSVVRTEEIY